MIQIPKQPNQFTAPIWDQPNDSDFNGTLYASFNIDTTENEGTLRLGKRLLLNLGTADDASLTSYPVGFATFANTAGIYTVAGATVWASTASYPSSAFVKLVDGVGGVSNPPITCNSLYSDIQALGSVLYVSADEDKVYYTADGLSWSNFTKGTAGSPHMMTAYQGNMYMTNGGNTIVSWTAARADVVTLTLTDSNITFLRSSSNRIWVGTINATGKGYVHEWDGISAQVTKSYRMEAQGALACVIKDDIPYVMDSNGSILVWNGGTFKKLESFRRKNNKLLLHALNATNNRFIHPNGMSIVSGKIHILIDGRNDSGSTPPTIEETIPSGVWEYDENKGLIHKYSFGQTKSAGTIVDFGQFRIAGAGALSEANYPNTAAARNGIFLCGATYYTNASSTTSGIFYDDSNDTLQKAGYFITAKLQAADENGSPSVQNVWGNVYTNYRKLLNAADEITVKYRVYDQDSIEATITWINNTSFTVLNSAVVVSDYWVSGTGGEVEIVNGVGGGMCSHITNAVLSTGTWTVTVDETYTGATGTARARFQNWKKVSEINYNSPTPNGVTYDQGSTGDLTNWIQFKVWMLFTGKNEIERMLIINKDTNPAN